MNQVLGPLTFIDQDSRHRNDEDRPLGIKSLGESFYAICQEEPDASLYDSWLCRETVRSLLLECEWYHFYNCVEHVAERLQRMEVPPWSADPAAWWERFGFEAYRQNVNQLLADHGVVWRVATNGQLERDMAEPLQKAIETVEEALAAGFEPATVAFNKARGFLTRHPLDPENAIKEIVSSVESVGRSIYPDTATLGDVAKRMRKAGYPSLLVDMIDKFYGFASAEPGVRHGGRTTPEVELADADFCLHVGTALIRYLIDWPAGGKKTPGLPAADVS
jgi:hypothetical protein